MLAASEPHSGSVIANAAIASPEATLGSHWRFCSSLPARLIAPEPSPCIAKAKSASPEWRARVSRAIARLRTSGGWSPSATHSSRNPASPRSRTSARHAESTSSECPSRSLSPHHCPSFAASSRWRGSKNGQSRCSVTAELRHPLGGEGFVGALEIPGLHQRRLRLGLHVERDLDRLGPFGVELALGHR